MMRIRQLYSMCLLAGTLLSSAGSPSIAKTQNNLPVAADVPAQPLRAQVRTIIDTCNALGSPLPYNTITAMAAAMTEPKEERQVERIQQILDQNCLLALQINPESRVTVVPGPARPTLLQKEWKLYLIKVYNQAGVTAPLHPSSPELMTGIADKNQDHWLDMKVYSQQNWVNYNGNDPAPPADKPLTGLPVEYRIVQIYSRDAGMRQAKLRFDVGQGTQDLGFRNEADMLFRCQPTLEVTLHVRDEKGAPSMAMFQFRDAAGHVYPSEVGRLAPDFFFQPQVYRADGEKVHLPAGAFTVMAGRGPEYKVETSQHVFDATHKSLSVKLARWIDPSAGGWWSGDHHIHAAGCKHYTNPTAGVTAADMMRSCLGEDLKVGCNLTWGPCFDYQKQFFTGSIDKVSRYPYLLRYDVEVSGFGSHESGHLCLLRLKNEIYPGGDSYHHWPKLGLSTLRWAKAQGAVCGPAHSGFGIETGTTDLPSYNVPKFNGIGANEYIVDVTHLVPGADGTPVQAVDFMSTCDTPYLNELNIWYHTLNCGYRTRISGETDFPCISGERVGKGRSYVKLDKQLDFDAWTQGIHDGRCYVSDGLSHLMDFSVNGLGVGENGSQLTLNAPGTVQIKVNAAAMLASSAPPSPPTDSYWSVERARIGASRTVPVEVIVNGKPVAKEILTADGSRKSLSFQVAIKQSSWVAVRILGSSHTNPVFVLVEGKPIRASKRSAEWCLAGVEQCWKSKQQFYAQTGETAEATRAYDHARDEYKKILAETAAEAE